MFGLVKSLFTLVGLATALWFGAHWYAEYRVRTAFAEAGMNDKAAACMGRRLVKRLSLPQLRRLEAFQAEKHTVGGLLRAVRQVDDSEVIAVTVSSAALCATGLAR
ncbi:hypothetical protein SAMN05518801_106166 [Novosphingobium sp. CF614]|uniref:hypothetical protein n=1 Tax=Novosphingobium sp. CF614 TaxID=1884364 RepID=UPI0008EA3B9D|nr:hypothetical protein [Novosphingobium sp. CF614]SFG05525.1 hypothetical protein SAMN05518801_106166 [Novosphingobium sp. CF614]